MGLFKSSARSGSESGLSLLQGMLILGVLGIIGAVVFRFLAG